MSQSAEWLATLSPELRALPLETAVARIWGHVLGLARVGIHDDFLALGGHSLMATRIVARVRRAGLTAIITRHLLAAVQDDRVTVASTDGSADGRYE